MTNDSLKKFASSAHSSPGIYIFKDGDKKLYIGKATNLKVRLSSYLKTTDPRILKMLSVAYDIELHATESDIEALILESQLIKKFRPQFNIVMRDDKQYFYVGFTSEVFPKIFLTHQPWASGACRQSSLIATLRGRGSPLRDSSPQRCSTAVCDRDSIIGNGLCPADGTLSEMSPGSPLGPPLAQYIHNFIGPFTDGDALKTTLRFLRSVFPYCTCKQLHHNFCLNYHIGKCFGYCCLKKQVWITDLRSRLSTGLFNLTTYKKNITSIKMVLSGKKKSVIRNLEKEMVQSAKRGDLEKAIELRNKISDLKRIFENARIIKTSEILKAHRSRLESLLKIQKPIIRIEGYDVSNIQGVHATGSMVTFIHDRPEKNFYRKFKIRRILSSETHGERGFGDVQMLAQILERRFRHDEWPFPDLILIDGGKGQVNMALKTLQNMTIKIPVVGVLKNERHIGHQLIIPGRKSPLPLTKLSPADRNLFLAIDSEAHRFAISYYRKLHRKLYK